MIIEIQDVLNTNQLAQIDALYTKAQWNDGSTTAGQQLVESKSNLEVKSGSDQHRELSKIVFLALAENADLELAVSPTGSSTPIFSKYLPGMSYPEHLDKPIVNYRNPSGSIFPARFRADVSATLFLNEPSEYEGGELQIKSTSGDESYKGSAGSMVFYPSNYLHQITEVTKGERRVAVMWFQSLYPNHEQRFQLYQLRTATANLLDRLPGDDDVKKVNATLNAMLQMFAR